MFYNIFSLTRWQSRRLSAVEGSHDCDHYWPSSELPWGAVALSTTTVILRDFSQ